MNPGDQSFMAVLSGRHPKRAYRLVQARELYSRGVRRPRQGRATQSTSPWPMTGNDRRLYRTLDEVVALESHREALLRTAQGDMMRFESKYHVLPLNSASVLAAMRSLAESSPRRRARAGLDGARFIEAWQAWLV